MTATTHHIDIATIDREDMSFISYLLRRFKHTISSGQRLRAMDGLFHDLALLRELAEREQWRTLSAQIRTELAPWASRDLLTYRCAAKPRGYAGDAPTLDVIYRHPDAPAYDADGLREDPVLTEFTTNRPASSGVRLRRQVLADAIDAAAARTQGARCLSLACGHLREAELSHALQSGGIGSMLAIDQDPESIALVRNTYRHLPIETATLGVRDLLRGVRPAKDLDLAYAAGLYDYLPEDVARRTTAALFDMLRPGGKLLVANFAPTLPDIGYMESCMDWWLIYRTVGEMEALTTDIDAALIRSVDTWKDMTGHIVYLEITRG